MSSRVNYRIRQNKALERIMQLHLTIDGMEQHHVNVEIQQTASQIQYMYIVHKVTVFDSIAMDSTINN